MQLKFILIIFCLFCLGCSETELVNGVSQKDSVEILVALSTMGIEGRRVQQDLGREAKYQITVKSGCYQRALKVLQDFNLPRSKEKSIESLFDNQGFVPPSPEVSAYKLDFAFALEVERLVEGLPGVVDARAIVRSSLSNLLLEQGWKGRGKDQTFEPRASIVVRYLSRSGLVPVSVDDIRKLVTQVVIGLGSEQVAVELHPLVVSFSDSLPTFNGKDARMGDGRLQPILFDLLSVPVEQAQSARQKLLLLFIGFALLCSFAFSLVAWGWGVRRGIKIASGQKGRTSGRIYIEAGAKGGVDRRDQVRRRSSEELKITGPFPGKDN